MDNRLSKFLVFVLMIFCCPSFCVYSKISVTAKLDSLNLLMGKLTTLYLEVVQDKGQKGEFEIFADENIKNKGYVGICGDSVELRTSYISDTTEIGSGRIQINYKIPLQSFDSATYRLPGFIFIAGGDTAKSNSLTFNVVPVPGLSADTPIDGFAPISEPEGKMFYDFIPDFILDFWWVFLITVLAICAFIYALRRYRKVGTILPLKSEPTAYEQAINGLRNLKERKLWERGLEKEYFTELTDILRIYMERRFGINAMEMTSRQIIEHLYDSDVKDKREYIRDVLKIADFVKFAKVRPLPADNIAAYDNAVKFVEETKPELMAQDEDELPGVEGGEA